MDSMVIRELQKHFPARTLEWLNALTIFCWGAYAVLRPEVFNEPAAAGFVYLVPHNPAGTWGLVTILMGIIQAAALVVNGAYHRSPLWRLAMSAGSAAMWSFVTWGFYVGGRPTFALVVYPCVLVLGNMISAYRASCDAVIADHTWRVSGAKKRGSTSGYVALQRG